MGGKTQETENGEKRKKRTKGKPHRQQRTERTENRYYSRHVSATNKPQGSIVRRPVKLLARCSHGIPHAACGALHTAYGSFFMYRRRILPPSSASQDVNTSRLLCRVTDTQPPLCGIEHIMNLLDRVVVVLSCCHLDVVLKMAEMDPRYFALRLKIDLEKKLLRLPVPSRHLHQPTSRVHSTFVMFPNYLSWISSIPCATVGSLAPSLFPHVRTNAQ